MNRRIRCILPLAALLAFTVTLQAQVEPQRPAAVAARELHHPDLTIPSQIQALGQLPAPAASQARQSLARLGVDQGTARVDFRSGRFETLLPATPLVAGQGVGNRLKAAAHDVAGLEQAARDAFMGYLTTHQDDLRIDLREVSTPRVTAYGGGALYHLTAQRTFDGIPVRGSYLSATINHGNLVLLGTHAWGDRGASANRPQISVEEATFAAEGHLLPLTVTGHWGPSERVYLPMARGQLAANVAFGQGYSYRLAWSVKVRVDGDAGSWEVLVDAHTGEVLANEDRNQYAEAKGGVYPVTNDGVVPDGVEQGGSPMPFMSVGSATTDTGGNYNLTGSQTATFNGPFVNMADQCGTDSLTQSGGIDWGTSGGTDCTTPGFGGAGNTHSSRTGFYELNKLKEMARGQLPSNTWLQNRLTANMNINNTCNAFWNGVTVNFYRSGGGCSNTGEIAGVFDHEWGHGMDANDATPGIAGPSGEGIADLYMALRLNTSCIGRNFRATACTGFGDPCLTCTGVRDIDYLAHQSGQPHDYTWSNANCGGAVHCVGKVYAEAVWSLWKRELTGVPYNMDNNTAHEVVNRLTFLGAGGVGTWFSGGPPNGGCGSSSGYMKFLAADDDNGNLNDGTPHMTAIFNAFNDQQIACQTPAVQDSGCANTPSSAPAVSTTPGNNSVGLSWNAVANATKYQVYRTEGVFACDFGKVKLGETVGTTWSDSGLQNGRDYSYVVIPIGGGNSCFGPASACATAAPAAAPGCVVDADCNDAVGCTVDSCNAGTCVNTPDDAACDNGAFCDGAEFCDPISDCQAGSNPCPGAVGCDEVNDVCIECVFDADCDDGLFCNGAETCNANTCTPGTDPCAGGTCDEANDLCPVCSPRGTSCVNDSDCCSNKCRGKSGAKTCK